LKIEREKKNEAGERNMKKMLDEGRKKIKEEVYVWGGGGERRREKLRGGERRKKKKKRGGGGGGGGGLSRSEKLPVRVLQTDFEGPILI